MSSLPTPAVFRLLVLLPLLVAGPLGGQTIHSVSDAEPRLVPGGDAVELRLEGSGLDGITEVRFLKDGREVRGLRGELRSAARTLTIVIVADRLMNPLDGVELELRGPRVRSPLRVPAKVLVTLDGGLQRSKTDGGKMPGPAPLPATDPPASDPSIQVESIDVERHEVYVDGSVEGRVRLTGPSSEAVEIELVNERPGSVQVPARVMVSPGQTEAAFEIRGLAPYIYLGDPWSIAIQARKVPFADGPETNVRVFDAPKPTLAIFPNTDLFWSGYDWGDTSYGAAPPAFPAFAGETKNLRIRLASEPVLGGSLQLSASGPASLPSTVEIPAGDDRIVSVPVAFGTVQTPGEVVVTVAGYGSQTQSRIDVYPDQLFVHQVSLKDCPSCTSASVVGGDAVRVVVTLSRAAEGGGYAVPIQVSDVSALAPVALTIPAGQDTAELIVGAQTTDAPRTVTLTIGDVIPHTFTLTVQPG